MTHAQYLAVVVVAALVIVTVIRFEVFCLTDILKAPETRHLPRSTWFVLALVSIPIGGIAYLCYGRPRH